MQYFLILSAFLSLAVALVPISRPLRRSPTAVSMAKQLKPTFDGTLREAGAALDEYVLEMENGSRAVCRTFGCNVYTYKTKDGIEVLGKRKDAVDIKSDSKAYAGGAPHCFPQFGPGALPQHGFARDSLFIPEERAKKLSFDRMIFKLEPTDKTKPLWDKHFEYRFDVTLREDCLEWDVIVINKDKEAFDVTLGLHTYYDISSLKNVVISGPFSGADTVDKATGATGKATSNDVIISGPIDMLYKNAKGPVTIKDSGKGTITTIESKGYSDWVIWNPYGNDAMGYDKFVCVEPVSSTPVSIPPGQFKETKFYQKVSCKKL